ncbi:hypothetical protein ACIREM_28155 [Streptomyces shenzhenensis]|uniref:hypothetical protein n=1 Tax=Streptomyces shenzhenensis TaxID=943815 RepID=UPI00382F9403
MALFLHAKPMDMTGSRCVRIWPVSLKTLLTPAERAERAEKALAGVCCTVTGARHRWRVAGFPSSHRAGEGASPGSPAMKWAMPLSDVAKPVGVVVEVRLSKRFGNKWA